MSQWIAWYPGVSVVPLLMLFFLVVLPAQEKSPNYQFTPVLHSVSYLGVWRGQAQLTLDQFLAKLACLLSGDFEDKGIFQIIQCCF